MCAYLHREAKEVSQFVCSLVGCSVIASVRGILELPYVASVYGPSFLRFGMATLVDRRRKNKSPALTSPCLTFDCQHQVVMADMICRVSNDLDIVRYFDDPAFSDLVVTTRRKSYHVHRIVLASQSSKKPAAFRCECVEECLQS